MDFSRLLIGLFEFGLQVAMLGFGIYFTYRTIIRANPDFDMEDEIRKSNLAVGVLVGAILLSVAMIVQKVVFSVVMMFRQFVQSWGSEAGATWSLPAIAAGHLVMAFVLAILTVSVTLRLFGRLTEGLQEGQELRKGNVAVGVLLASVVLTAALFVSEGVSSLSKALTPQTSIGRVQILR